MYYMLSSGLNVRSNKVASKCNPLYTRGGCIYCRALIRGSCFILGLEDPYLAIALSSIFLCVMIYKMPPPRRPSAWEVSFPEEAAAELEALHISQANNSSSASPSPKKRKAGDERDDTPQRVSSARARVQPP